mmetsp:Transcript_6314/g.21735  ORF Transcript_6314/g.21735 Transcript_6314/m.21735 type:complete len:135 (+) Transcript_6314:190-594(+)
MQLSGPRNKASREKLRRERLNDRFAQLAQLIDPGKPPKTDKATILTDAARVVSGLRSEVGAHAPPQRPMYSRRLQLCRGSTSWQCSPRSAPPLLPCTPSIRSAWACFLSLEPSAYIGGAGLLCRGGSCGTPTSS